MFSALSWLMGAGFPRCLKLGAGFREGAMVMLQNKSVKEC